MVLRFDIVMHLKERDLKSRISKRPEWWCERSLPKNGETRKLGRTYRPNKSLIKRELLSSSTHRKAIFNQQEYLNQLYFDQQKFPYKLFSQNEEEVKKLIFHI